MTVRALSLSECVRTAVQHNFDVKIEEKSVDIARHQLGGFYGAYDPVLGAGVNRGHSRDPDLTTTTTDSFTAELAGLLPSGLTYELGTLNGSFSDSNGVKPPPDGPFETAGGSVAVRLPKFQPRWRSDGV